MEAVAPAVARTEDAPSARTQIGGREALAVLYERHLDELFDFALRVARTRDVAATVVRKVFAKEGASATELYVTARDSLLDELRCRRRSDRYADEREGFDFTRVDADRVTDPSAVLFDKELIELVWDCAAELMPSDYAALDLHVRRGLGPDELGESESRLARLCGTFEDSAMAALLARRARHTCEGLDASTTLRDVRQHARTCEVCQETKRRFISPLEVFASLAPIVPTRSFREDLWKQLAPSRSAHSWALRFRR